MKIRHSILVVTYKQQELIGACLESIISQSVTPYEVVVVDDCSPDNTWNIVRNYASKFNYIKPYRNETNLGVFQNLNNALKYVSGDFVNVVAGDDLLPENILQLYNEFIEKNKLDCQSSFLIFTNSLVLQPDGRKILKENSKCFVENKIFELACMQCFWSWDTGISIGVWKQLTGIRTDLGYQADLLWHLDKIACAQRIFFMNEIGYIYRASCGVTVATRFEEHDKSRKAVINEIIKKYPDRITPKINNFFIFDKQEMEYMLHPSVKNYFLYIWRYLNVGTLPIGNRHRNRLSLLKVLIPISCKRMLKKMYANKKYK